MRENEEQKIYELITGTGINYSKVYADITGK